MHDIIKEILKQQKAERKRAEGAGKKKKEEEWRFYITPPKPARWRARVIPLVKLPEALGIAYKRPEYWDLCRDVEDPVRCYRLLVKRLRDRELFGAFLQALMSGADLKIVMGYVEKGDKDGLKEYVYSRFRP